MNKLLLIPALMLPLMAAKCDEQLRSVLAQTCDGLAVAYSHYDAVAGSGLVKTGTMNRVAAVRIQTDYLCAHPERATTVSVTAIAAKAYVELSAAFRQAGTAGDAGYSQVNDLRNLLERAR